MAKTTKTHSLDEQRAMSTALGLARRGLGQTWPNPAVGCVLVRPDLGIYGKARIVGRGWTQPGGRPHAETQAIASAGDLANGATAFVTLEPCCHHGETGPCTKALVDAGISRVIIAMHDPDPRVAGKGIAELRDAGVDCDLGLLEHQARDVNLGFVSKITGKRPLVTLKIATSLDGRIATCSGHSKWVTGPAARARGHLLRAEHDAILCGRGTIVADDPQLTCRLAGMESRSPTRIVLDSKLRTPLSAAVITQVTSVSTWIMTGTNTSNEAEQQLSELGVRVFRVAEDEDGRLDPGAVLHKLAEQGITRLLIEGGAEVATSFLCNGLVDRIAWFRAPIAIGDDGLPALAVLGIVDMETAPRFVRRSIEILGEDTLEILAITSDGA